MLRFVLKHLRQRRFLTPFQSALERSGIQLEHPLITSLHTALVLQGNFPSSEAFLHSIASIGLFSASLSAQPPHTQWTRLRAADADGDAPSARGGHAMCIDNLNGKVYLFGGWDGQKNLDDFWEYDVHTGRWRVICYATQREPNGPGPRSCHKMLFDAATGDIYLFGQLECLDIAEIAASGTHTRGVEAPATSPVSPGLTTPPTLGSPRASGWSSHTAELYCYHTRGRDEGRWEIVVPDTSVSGTISMTLPIVQHKHQASGGPPMVFDHQMTIDSDARVIYLSGGRVVDGDWESVKLAALYSFDLHRKKWEICR